MLDIQQAEAMAPGRPRNRTEQAAIIIPVYNALSDLALCLESVHKATPPEVEVLVLDDASTDPEVPRFLRQWLGDMAPSWRLEIQQQNLGFVGTVNRGMQATSGDVILLNSDTLVTPGWYQGLNHCLRSDPRIATAMPWINNGEIASIGGMCLSAPLPPEPDKVASLIAGRGVPDYPDL